MKNLVYIIIILFTLLSCDGEEETNLPECIKTQIKNIEANSNYPISNPRMHIDMYNYLGKIVYILIDPQTNSDADNAVSVFNEKCETICLLGGIDGSKNDCINWNTATFIRTVWTDPR